MYSEICMKLEFEGTISPKAAETLTRGMIGANFHGLSQIVYARLTSSTPTSATISIVCNMIDRMVTGIKSIIDDADIHVIHHIREAPPVKSVSIIHVITECPVIRTEVILTKKGE